jgi:hypothetical protein
MLTEHMRQNRQHAVNAIRQAREVISDLNRINDLCMTLEVRSLPTPQARLEKGDLVLGYADENVRRLHRLWKKISRRHRKVHGQINAGKKLNHTGASILEEHKHLVRDEQLLLELRTGAIEEQFQDMLEEMLVLNQVKPTDKIEVTFHVCKDWTVVMRARVTHGHRSVGERIIQGLQEALGASRGQRIAL